MNLRTSNFLFYQFPVILWAAIILTVSSVPLFAEVKPKWTNYDKIIHLIEYGIFGFLLTRALYFQSNANIKRFAVILSIVIGVIFAAFDEIHQKYIPGRFGSIGDFIADFSGIMIAQIFFLHHIMGYKINLKSLINIFKTLK